MSNTVKTIMIPSENVIKISYGRTISDTAALILKKKIGSVLVLDIKHFVRDQG
jgi:hypothetical protein